MNATAERLDHYLRDADPASARAVEQIVGLLIQRFQTGSGSQPQTVAGSYRIKTRSMGPFKSGFDPHKLGQIPEDF